MGSAKIRQESQKLFQKENVGGVLSKGDVKEQPTSIPLINQVKVKVRQDLEVLVI